MAKIKVLHYSTHNEDCGIGKYQEQFLAAMAITSIKEIHNEFFDYSPNVTKVMTYDQFTVVLRQLKQKLKKFDILHIQHELSFYKHDELGRIVDAAREAGKKVIFTVHTAPDAQYRTPHREGYGLHSIMKYLREVKAAREFSNIHISPMQRANLILVHNTTTKDSLVKHGVSKDKIQKITLPVPNVSFDMQSTEIKEALNYQAGDVILGSVGFISPTKGVREAVKALTYLPDNYKLAVIGGIHPAGGGEAYLDEVCDLIIKEELKNRVYITGYVDDDSRLNSLIRECDACVYPYDRQYYTYVSSAALNNALANHKPAIAYPTKPFIEMNDLNTIVICKSANYYELARYVTDANYGELSRSSVDYAQIHSYTNEAKKLAKIYQKFA